ncbi:MAG: ATP-binding protein, partial [Spirochaetota bacterium]|nr:ATP-binding protein [Spirochaetota bacterium]
MKKEKELAQAESINNLRLVNERLRHIDKLKDEFLANTSHELKTPLNGIIGITDSILTQNRENLNPHAIKQLTMVAYGGKQLLSLVNDILDFAKIKNSELLLQKKTVDLHSLLSSILILMKPLADNKALILRNTIPENLPPVLADENRLSQIIYNLISNAIKFSDKGEIILSARPDNNQKIHIMVSDNGIGIPEDQTEAIFDSFEQLDGSATRSQGGTGLGLTITKKLIELHGESITLKSKPGEGSQFSFSLPVSDEKVESHSPLNQMIYQEQDLNDLTEDTIQKDFLIHPDNHFRLLLVDDDPLNLTVLVNYLSFKNCDLVKVSSGPDALQSISDSSDNSFDIILLDVMMPGMSGYQVCEKIRESHSQSELPVLLLTARNQVEDLVMGFDAGANDYITKPLLKEELLSRVTLHLNLSSRSRELTSLNENLEDLVMQRTGQLKKSEEHYRKLVELSPDWIILHRDKEIVFMSGVGLTHVNEENPENLIGQPLNKIIEKRYHLEFDSYCRQLTNNPDLTKIMDLKIKTGPRQSVDMEFLSTGINIDNDNLILTIARDISERQRIQTLKDDVERVARHDLRNRFHSILGFVDFIKNKYESLSQDKLFEYLSHIQVSTKNAEKLILRSLDLYKMETGQYKLVPREFNLVTLFKRLDESFDRLTAARFINLKHIINNRNMSWDDKYLYSGEETYLENLFQNLIKNAIDASPHNKDITININENNQNAKSALIVDIHNFGAVPEEI